MASVRRSGTSTVVGWLALLLVGIGVTSCETKRGPDPVGSANTELTAPTETGPLVAFVGDSITAGLNVERDQAFPAVLRRRLSAVGVEMRVLNAGRSGDTTAGGLARIDWILAQSPDLIVLELGGNDGLRGQPLADIEANLRAIITKCRQASVEVILLGMRIPTSYGDEYAEGFAALYETIGRDLGVETVPFFMEPVAGQPELNQPDGIHPTVEGHQRLAESLALTVRRATERLTGDD